MGLSDRGLIDDAAALERATGESALAGPARAHRYHRRVFLAPPWPAIHVTDGDRRHDFNAATAEYTDLCRAYALSGYDVDLLPRTSIAQRTDYILNRLAGRVPRQPPVIPE